MQNRESYGSVGSVVIIAAIVALSIFRANATEPLLAVADLDPERRIVVEDSQNFAIQLAAILEDSPTSKFYDNSDDDVEIEEQFSRWVEIIDVLDRVRSNTYPEQ